MTEIGHPFSKPFQEIIESLEESIREGVEQPAQIEILFRRDTPSYEIRGPVLEVSRVSGLRGKQHVVFEKGLDYRYSSGRLIWSPSDDPAATGLPDDNSRILVEYTYRDLPSGITDFNAGSVAGTLVRAVARELKLLYEQMDQAYRRAFIDIAEGPALDNVAALVGKTRNRAVAATGSVTFFLKKPPREAVLIPVKTRVADSKGRIFLVTAGDQIPPGLEETHAPSGVTVRTDDRIGALDSVKVKGTGTPLSTQPTAPGKEFGADERTITLAAAPPSGDLLVAYKPKSVTVPVAAAQPGRDGNLGSGSITVMPTPPRGVDGGVVNEEPLTGGEEAESDAQLRERTKHALERAGNATLNALKFSILEVEGVEGVEVRDHESDESIPLGEVRVRYSGRDEAGILAAIERTRAAGIAVRAEAITTLFLSGNVYVIPGDGFGLGSVEALRKEIVAALKELAIGEAAYVRRFTALAYAQPGLADVAEAQLDYVKKAPGGSSSPPAPVTDPFVPGSGELVRPDEGHLAVMALDRIDVHGTYVAAANRTDLQIRLLIADGTAVRFRSFKLDLTVVLKARLKTAPDQPTQRICQVQAQVQFTGVDAVTVPVANVSIKDAPAHPGFRLGADGHDPHVEFQVIATAYPGLEAGMTPVDITGIS